MTNKHSQFSHCATVSEEQDFVVVVVVVSMSMHSDPLK